MDGSESAEREQHLRAVRTNGLELRDVPERYRADREIVLAAVQENGVALYDAAEYCKADMALGVGGLDRSQRMPLPPSLPLACRRTVHCSTCFNLF
eukprot:545913-Amphidinium_carterae.1